MMVSASFSVASPARRLVGPCVGPTNIRSVPLAARASSRATSSSSSSTSSLLITPRRSLLGVPSSTANNAIVLPAGALIDDRVTLGTSELSVSATGVGAWAWGDRSGYWGSWDRDENLAAYRTLLAGGVDFVDTAVVYGFGKSEELLNEFMVGVGWGCLPPGCDMTAAQLCTHTQNSKALSPRV